MDGKTARRAGMCLLLATLLAAPALGAEPAPKQAPKQTTAKPPRPARPAMPAPAPRPPAPPELVRELGGISEYRLANGLQILLFPDPSKPTITVNLTYKVGSRHEDKGEAGMAHLLEHLLFKGTPEFADIPGEFARRGMRANGTTTVDRTNYFSSFNASPETLAFALQLEASRMLRSFIRQSDLEREMPVVRNELEIGDNNPGQLLRQRVMSAAYRFHPYGQPTIGTLSDLEQVPIARLQAFYRLHYQPDNAVLMIAGQFESAQALALIGQHFGPLPRPSRRLEPVYTVEPPQDGERAVTLRRVGGAPQLLALYHVPGMAHPDCPVLNVLGPLLAQPPSGSLYKALVENKLAGQVFAGGCGGYDPGVFAVGAVQGSGATLPSLERLLLEQTEGAGRPYFSAEEVQRVAAQAALSVRQILKSPERAVLLLSEAVAAGDWRLIFKNLEDVQRVSAEDVQRVAQKYLQPSNRSLGRYQPVAKAERVEVPLVVERSAGLEGLKLDEAISTGESFDTRPEALQSRTRQLQPAPGLRLALLPKQNRGDSAVLAIRLRWADLPSVHRQMAAALVGPLLQEGTLQHDRQALLDESVRLKGGLRLSAGPQGASIVVQGERDTLLPLLALLREVLREPRFAPEAFERLQRQGLAALQAAARQPEALRQEATREHYNRQWGLHSGDVGYQDSPAERFAQWRAIDLAQVKEFYTRYWSANEMDVAAVGSLPDGLEAELVRLFADWKKPSAPAYQRWSRPFQAVAPARFDALLSDKANALLLMRQELRVGSRDADFPALVLANQMLGGGLDSRLAKRVRQQEGLSYRVGSSLSANAFDERGVWSISASFAPENRERLLAIIQAELARTLAQGFEAEELEHARNNVLQSRQQARSNDGALAGELLQQLDTGEDWLGVAREDQRRREVTLEQVNAALRRHLLPQAWVISSAGDYQAKPPIPPAAPTSPP